MSPGAPGGRMQCPFPNKECIIPAPCGRRFLGMIQLFPHETITAAVEGDAVRNTVGHRLRAAISQVI